jgi:hypothetical protein
MTEAPLVLPVFPWPLSPERDALLRAAKARIDTPIKIVPVEAMYGSPGRVLCFGALPPFLAKTLPISPQNVDSIDSIERALRAWLDPWADLRQFDEAFQMGFWMGCDVRLSHEEDESGVVFA